MLTNLIRKSAAAVTIALSALSSAIAQSQPSGNAGPFLLVGERLNRGLPAPLYTLYDDKNRQMAIAQNGEIRWFDDIKRPPVRTAKITEVPKPELTAEQVALAAEAKRYHETIWGDLPENFCDGCELVQRPGGKEFCLTDRDRHIFFYSTATGELLRKFMLKKPKQKFAPSAFAISNDGKVVLTQNTEARKAYVHSLETGEQLFEIDTLIFDSVGLSTDGATLFVIKGNTLSRYSVATGKRSAADFAIKADSAGIIQVSPDGERIAFNLYGKGGVSGGQAIFELKTQKLTVVDATLSHCGVMAFTPDGKFLAVHVPRYLHFVDVTTGKHTHSYNSGYPDIWDTVIDPSFSPDSKKVSFRPAGGLDVKAPYFVYCDLAQPRERLVTKLK